jgi:two-component system sensor histidine kinase KdpD
VDDGLIQRVLRNLINNACKHAGPYAQVVLRAQPADNGVQVCVEDDGPGIPVEQRERVFERFFQGDRAGPGSGLGLAFCRLVVERHGGRIWAEDSALGGARVCLTLPTSQRATTLPAVTMEREVPLRT